ncbi:MAG: pyrroloquinoline quinone biosynthesis protein PqqE [Candidatus Korobacteraceae bacterium]|jgi:pyrroloquinoline quinone biosynthesis protein E
MKAPLSIICELTHRCPLRCVYCSNPLELAASASEMTTTEWVNTMDQAAEMGILHAHFTGGEPLARADLNAIVAAARQAGLYSNLITSGIGLTEARLDNLIEAGLDHVQLSFQGREELQADEIAGTRAHTYKLKVAEWIRSRRIAFTVNLVVHRRNLDELEELIDFCASLGPQRLEIANVQYYGWALENRMALMPTREQMERSVRIVESAKRTLAEKLRIDFVPPDYYGSQPKACMGGWASQTLIIDPAGRALPCHAAGVIPGLNFDSVREKSLRWIWTDSPAMNKFRGDEWMAEPCRSCERKTIDFGGCRCQAFLLTGNASNADPVCTLSPHHELVKSIAAAESVPTYATTTHAGDPTSASPCGAAADGKPSGWVYRIFNAASGTPKADVPPMWAEVTSPQ